MKRIFEKIKEIFCKVIIFPTFVVAMFFLIIITPFDYFKYKRTRYYKDTHEKYSWFCASSYYIMLYDLIKKENLPIEYFRGDRDLMTGYGYFIYKDILILNDCDVCFDTDENTWAVQISGDLIELQKDVSDSIEMCNNFLKKEVCKKAIVLIDSKLYNKHPGFEYELFDFVTVSKNNIVEALRIVVD